MCDLADASIEPPPPHGPVRCRRSRLLTTRTSGSGPFFRTLPATSSSPPATSSRGRLRLSPDFFRKQMVTHGRSAWFLVFATVGFSLPAWSAISTSTPTPPFQWLNVTRLLSGPSAPPLKGASIGYDETTRTLVVFGGESESGFPTSKTYLCAQPQFSDIPEANAYRACSLNLDSLIWTVPTPPSGLDDAPSPRSRAIGGLDWAANQRQCHIVIGGRGSDGGGLSDVWVSVCWLVPSRFTLMDAPRSTITSPNSGHPLLSRRVALQVAGGPLAATTTE